MQCLRYLCVQCRDPMKLVTLQNGVSVPDGTGRLVMLHSECFVAWLNVRCAEAWSKEFDTPLPEQKTHALAAD
jgi:hypothetical protein